MARGICVFAEHWEKQLSPVFYELVLAAQKIGKTTGEPIQVILAAREPEHLLGQMSGLPLDQIYVTRLSQDYLFQDEVLSEIYAKMLLQVQPSVLLVPANDQGRSIFPRVAYRLNAGMTADCTELDVARREDGSFYLRQLKPSFESNVKVCIACKEGRYPQIATVREGVYEPCPRKAGALMVTPDWLEIEPERVSAVSLLGIQTSSLGAGNLQAAEIVVVGGRGAAREENFELLCELARELGAAVGGTRPLMDLGKVPFEDQIGQTGCTIRPKICLSFGVSGAIQHTEGIKNTKLFLAVNTEKDAPIFQVADYGVAMDMGEILRELLCLLRERGGH